jgi:osmotically-inducible protein OsmY
MGVTQKGIRSLALMSLGAGFMYLFDPVRGRSRRVRAKDQAAGLVRRNLRQASRAASQQIHYTEGRLEGTVAKASGAGAFRPESEVDLREHLRQVIAELDFPTTDVTVEVAGGVAALRGQVMTAEQMESVALAVSRVPGVDRVDSFLHLPDTPAPNKSASYLAEGYS